MAIPYLDPGESLIQTTDRISVHAVLSDLLLTNRRLIFVDSSHGNAEPVLIPFSSIVSLQGGWNAAGDPVVTLTLAGEPPDELTRQLDLVFSQLPGEHRKEESDGWVGYLMEQIVRGRQETSTPDASGPPPEEEPGLHPSVRRVVSPDMIEPHNRVKTLRPQPSGIVITPPPSQKTPDKGTPKEAPTPPIPETGQGGVEGADPGNTAESGKPDKKKGKKTRKTGAARSKKTPVQGPDTGPGTKQKEGKIVEEKIPEVPVNIEEMVKPVSPDPLSEKVSPSEMEFPVSVFPEPVKTGSPEIEGTINRPASLEQHPETMSASIPEGISWPVITESAGSTQDLTEATTTKCETSGISETSPSPGSADGKTASGPNRRVLITGIAICLVLVVIIGGVFVLSHYPIKSVTPLPVPVPTATPAPVTTTIVPAVVIPANGVWVRVMSDSIFVGSIGNPGNLQTVSGSGNQFYRMPASDDFVQVSFQKQGYAGELMTIEVYNLGNLVIRRTTDAPRGTINFLIDPKTGNPPGISRIPSDNITQRNNG